MNKKSCPLPQSLIAGGWQPVNAKSIVRGAEAVVGVRRRSDVLSGGQKVGVGGPTMPTKENQTGECSLKRSSLAQPTSE